MPNVIDWFVHLFFAQGTATYPFSQKGKRIKLKMCRRRPCNADIILSFLRKNPLFLRKMIRFGLPPGQSGPTLPFVPPRPIALSGHSVQSFRAWRSVIPGLTRNLAGRRRKVPSWRLQNRPCMAEFAMCPALQRGVCCVWGDWRPFLQPDIWARRD